MPVDSSPPSETSAAAIESSSIPATQRMDPAMEARWAAWVARGHQHDLAFRRKFRIAILSAAIILGLIALAFRLFGGAF